MWEVAALLQNTGSTDVKECDGLVLALSGFGLGGDKGWDKCYLQALVKRELA